MVFVDTKNGSNELNEEDKPEKTYKGSLHPVGATEKAESWIKKDKSKKNT